MMLARKSNLRIYSKTEIIYFPFVLRFVDVLIKKKKKEKVLA